jgi:integrase
VNNLYNKNQIKEIEFLSRLNPVIKDFLREKRAMGLEYNLQAKILKRFDTFAKNYNFENNTLPKEIVDKWIAKNPNETHQNQRLRILTIRQLGLYMKRQGYEAYMPSLDVLGGTKTNFVPYIFSKEELLRFFKKADSMHYEKQSPIKHLVIPLLFKILYGCGLRISEALNLKIKDVDIENGVLIILHAKFNHQRLVPMSNSLTKICKTYLNTVHKTSSDDDIFLPSPNKCVYAKSLIYREFRKLLWQAGISHGGKGNGPRIHDFRHTFAVNCLKKWVLNKVDVSSALPVLSAYLGHSNLNGTQHYLRLTSDLFPEITADVEEHFGYCIPQVYGGEYIETN